MKIFIKIFFLAIVVFIAGCRGEQGPPGAPGEDGLDGDLFLPQVFEIEGDFTAENEFSLFFEFPSSIEVFESDIVLAYILWDVVESQDGEDLDLWRLLPQTVALNEGVFMYNYDHTFVDVSIFMEGTVDLATLPEGDLANQVFRIVVLPADFNVKNNLRDIEDFNLMMKSIGIDPKSVKPEISLKIN
ncbi:MAG TPA: hypothetical protein VFD91_07735 [Mariniphaga sp.]|nr:hypothetical protein [Mariniphaga sp.]